MIDKEDRKFIDEQIERIKVSYEYIIETLETNNLHLWRRIEMDLDDIGHDIEALKKHLDWEDEEDLE